MRLEPPALVTAGSKDGSFSFPSNCEGDVLIAQTSLFVMLDGIRGCNMYISAKYRAMQSEFSLYSHQTLEKHTKGRGRGNRTLFPSARRTTAGSAVARRGLNPSYCKAVGIACARSTPGRLSFVFLLAGQWRRFKPVRANSERAATV